MDTGWHLRCRKDGDFAEDEEHDEGEVARLVRNVIHDGERWCHMEDWLFQCLFLCLIVLGEFGMMTMVFPLLLLLFQVLLFSLNEPLFPINPR